MGIPFLSGLRVLEYASLVAGPFCGKLLGDLGADVIKIESPGAGDVARQRGPFPGDVPDSEQSLLHHYVNANKRGVSLSLDSPTGRDVFRRLVEVSDLLIEDTTPGALDSFGLGYGELERINPALVLLSITPFGQSGPHRHWQAYNLNTIHAGGEGWLMPPGLTHRLFPGREPLKKCGVTAAVAAIIGMFGRQAGGRGQHIDMSKQEAHATLARIAIGLWAQTGFVETRATRDIPYGGCVPCKDGHVEILFHIADHHWDSLVEMIGNPEWAADPKFKDQEGRSANGAEANGHLFAWAKDRTKWEIYGLGLEHGIPCGIFLSPSEIVESRQERERGFFVETEHPPVEGLTNVPGLPFQFSGYRYGIDRWAPRLGQHNAEVYSGLLGYGRGELSSARSWAPRSSNPRRCPIRPYSEGFGLPATPRRRSKGGAGFPWTSCT